MRVLKCRVRTQVAENPYRNCVFINTNGQICKEPSVQVLAGTTNYKPNHLHLTLSQKDREEHGIDLKYGDPVLKISIIGIGLMVSTFVGMISKTHAKLSCGHEIHIEDLETIVASGNRRISDNLPAVPFTFIEKYRDRGNFMKAAGVVLDEDKSIIIRDNGTCIMAKADANYDGFISQLMQSPIGRSFGEHIISMMEDNNISHRCSILETKRPRTRIPVRV